MKCKIDNIKLTAVTTYYQQNTITLNEDNVFLYLSMEIKIIYIYIYINFKVGQKNCFSYYVHDKLNNTCEIN